jgi:hypothetical protein
MKRNPNVLKKKKLLDLYDKRITFRRCLLLYREISKHGSSSFLSVCDHVDLPGSVYST